MEGYAVSFMPRREQVRAGQPGFPTSIFPCPRAFQTPRLHIHGALRWKCPPQCARRGKARERGGSSIPSRNFQLRTAASAAGSFRKREKRTPSARSQSSSNILRCQAVATNEQQVTPTSESQVGGLLQWLSKANVNGVKFENLEPVQKATGPHNPNSTKPNSQPITDSQPASWWGQVLPGIQSCKPSVDWPQIQGKALLVGVAALWAVYAVNARGIFMLPEHPPVSFFTCFGKGVASISFLLIKMWMDSARAQSSGNPQSKAPPKELIQESRTTGGPPLSGPSCINWSSTEEQSPGVLATSNSPARSGEVQIASRPLSPPAKEWALPAVLVPALEIGLWEFVSTALETSGLMHTTATRAGFIGQTTNVLVPLMSSLGGKHVQPVTWFAAVLAMAGVVTIGSAADAEEGEGENTGSMPTDSTLDKASFDFSQDTAAATQLLGDLEILGMSFFTSLFIVRLSSHVRSHDACTLAATSNGVSAVFAGFWAVTEAAHAELYGSGAAALFEGWTQDPSILLRIAGGAFFCGTLGSLAMAYGQKTVPPAQAQILYSLEPLFASLLAAALLHESLPALGYLGGSTVILASLLSA